MDMETLKKATKLKFELDKLLKLKRKFESITKNKIIDIRIRSSKLQRDLPDTIYQWDMESIGLKDDFDKLLELGKVKTLERIKERYHENGIDNVEIVGKMKEHDKKIKMDKELVENMQSKRKYTEEELETIYDVK